MAAQAGLTQSEEYAARHVKAAQKPALCRMAGFCEERRHRFVEIFNNKHGDWDDAKTNLSSPNVSVDLAFPFLGPAISKRFTIRKDEGNSHYMGREVFSDFMDAFELLTEGSLRDLCVYGPIGYGKSHLLAALTCFLTAYGYRVIYLPDLHICHETPVRYI